MEYGMFFKAFQNGLKVCYDERREGGMEGGRLLALVLSRTLVQKLCACDPLRLFVDICDNCVR